MAQMKQKRFGFLTLPLRKELIFLDTADLYHYGLNEEIVGKAIRDRRADIVLATKVGNRWTEEKKTVGFGIHPKRT
ncbi:hypothetical protein GCM10020331_042260 [Ectobacillus funiculus]